MRCPSCGEENPQGVAFCGHCGEPLPKVCPRCGAENPRRFSFCGRCGADLSEMAPNATRPSLEGERRFVVVLFADIAGFTRLSEQLDAEEATTLVNRCLGEMTEAVIRQGGRVDKYTGDGLMAVFGAPVAREDDPERAVRAALAMERSVDTLKLDLGIPQVSLHIGLACGQAVAAEVGGAGRREYTVIGRSVNLACRLQEVSAPGQILVSTDLARLTGHIFPFRRLLLPHLQGWEGQVEAYEVVEAGTDAGLGQEVKAQSPLVGRAAEMALLQQLVDRTAEGQGRVVSLIGEAGIGKTRLLEEVRQKIEERGLSVQWLVGSAVEAGEATRYSCFRSLLLDATGGNEQTEAEMAGRLTAMLTERMGERAEQVTPYLSRVLGLPLDGDAVEHVKRLDGESLKRQVSRALEEWVEAEAEREPLVLVFEDLHWAGPASVELLERTVEVTQRARVMVVLTFRPEVDRPVWRLRDVAGREVGGGYSELWLQPLSPAAVEQMMGHLLGTGDIPVAARKRIMTQAEGNPLFIEEIVRSMVYGGALLRSEGGAWELAPDWAETDIPDTIQGILQARVDRLDVEAKKVLQVASCIGRRFQLKLLAAVVRESGLSQERLNQCLRSLEEMALIQREEGPAGGMYAFRHVLLREALHSSLLEGARAQFHEAVAHWYEENTLQSGEPPYPVLAYHYEQAGDYDRQRLYFGLAGHQALRSYDNSEAVAFFTRALALTTDDGERFALLLGREEALGLMGERGLQRADLEELLHLAEQMGDDRSLVEVCDRFAFWHDSRGDYPAAIEMAERGLAAARRVGDGQMEAQSLRRIASAAWRQGRFPAALQAGRKALELAREDDDAARQAHSLTTVGVIYRSLGDLVSARTCYLQALDLRRAIGDMKGEAISLIQLGNVMYDEGDYTGAFDHHQQALDMFRMVGDPQGEAWALSGLGAVYLACGEYETARMRFEEALALRRAVGDRRGEAVALSDLGSALTGLGQFEAARTHLEKSAARLRSIGARRDEVYVLTYLARLYEEMGNMDGAQVAHQAALSRRREQKQQAAGVENVAGLARVALGRDDLTAARTYVEQVLVSLRQEGTAQLGAPFLVYWTCVRVLRACGEDDAARQVLTEVREQLMERASGIADPVLRRSFLERVPENQAIIAAWQEEAA